MLGIGNVQEAGLDSEASVWGFRIGLGDAVKVVTA